MTRHALLNGQQSAGCTIRYRRLCIRSYGKIERERARGEAKERTATQHDDQTYRDTRLSVQLVLHISDGLGRTQLYGILRASPLDHYRHHCVVGHLCLGCLRLSMRSSPEGNSETRRTDATEAQAEAESWTVPKATKVRKKKCVLQSEY